MTNDEIIAALRKLIPIPTQVFPAKVISVDMNNYSCVVEPFEGAELQDVRLKAGVEVEKEGLVEIPRLDSVVLVGLVGNDADTAYVVKCSKVSKIIINGGDLGGLVKIEELRESFDSVKDYVTDLKMAVSAGFDAVGAGSAANGATGKSAFELAMLGKVIEIKNMENENIIH